jgi:transcriptional regulator with XRE-family HTH domain
MQLAPPSALATERFVATSPFLLEPRAEWFYHLLCPLDEARRPTSNMRGMHMSNARDMPSQARDLYLVDSTDADRLRALLERAGLSQRAAARLLNVEERTMRQWCAGQGRPPVSVVRALNPRLTYTESLRRMIDSNKQTIDALQDGRITGLGYGRGPSDPQSVVMEIDRLRKLTEESQALLRLEEAFQRKQEAYFGLNGQWLPHGNGLPTDESISEMDAAEEEFRAAQTEVDRITQEIRAGKR